MSISQSRDTIVANVVQQGSALVLWLSIPQLLPIEHYAEVVFVGVVLSISRYSDLGMSSVYLREVPRLGGAEAAAERALWQGTLVGFSLIGGAFAGIAALLVIRYRFGAWTDAVLIAFLPLLGSLIATYLTMASAHGDFRAYRNCQFGLSLSRLIAIPLVFAHGILGWLVAQVAALALVVAGLGSRWLSGPATFDRRMIGRHLPTGLQLALISLLWSQLLDAACLLAAIHYPVEGIAAYGIVAAGSQSLCSLAVAAYLPVAVKTLGLLGTSDRAAAEYLYDIVDRTVPVVFLVTIAAAELSPWLLALLFPKYGIDPAMPRLVLYGLTSLPFVATLGSLFVGKQQTVPYLGILVVACGAAVGLESQLRPELGVTAAAIGQAGGAAVLVLLMVAGTLCLFSGAAAAAHGRLRLALGKLAALWAIYLAARYALG